MAAPLRVDPEVLRSAAALQSGVAGHLSGVADSRIVSGVATALARLDTAAACVQAGSLVERIAALLAVELADHAERLAVAADLYTRADEEIARWAGCR
ncbi:type VII secretion target [Mycobacterium sp. WMMD1722]|uniref:type VII secretion target n=1 Tax=Mycobacterium sp. WMMD1722 TaxID=3404117 RepID=UPI003BF534EF